MGDAEDRSCFLCAISDARALYRVCDCNLYAHAECAARLLTVPAHATHCAACRRPYEVSTVWRRRIECHAAYATAILVALGFGVANGVLGVALPLWEDGVSRILLGFAGLLGIALGGWMHRMFHLETRRLCCVWTEAVPVRRTLHLSAPV